MNGARAVREELYAETGKEIDLHIVWTRVLRVDTRELAEKRARELAHKGVTHYWDDVGLIGLMLAGGDLPLGKSPLAWDVYLFFDAAATWEVEGLSAEVSLWTHQLSGADPKHSARGKIRESLAACRRALYGTPEERVAGALSVIREAETLDGEAIGDGGQKSATYRAYERLRESATQTRLHELCGEKNPIVRCYAVAALVERHPGSDFLALAGEHVADLERVEQFVGCTRFKPMTGDVMMRLLREKITAQNQTAFHELLMGSMLEERGRMLREERLPDSWRLRLLDLVEERDDDALVALARIGNRDDWVLMDQALRDRKQANQLLRPLEAAALLPDPRLLPALERLDSSLHKPGHVRLFYEALAAQESEEAARVLAEFLASDPKRAVKTATHLAAALAECRARPFAPFLWDLWRGGTMLAPVTIDHLASLDHERARTQAETDLSQKIKDLPDVLVGTLFNLQPRKRQIELVAAALRAGDIPWGVGVHAWALRDTSFVEPLFACLGNTNPHDFLRAAWVLLAFDSPEIEARLRLQVAETEHLRTGWGGKKLAELLAE